MKKMIFIMIFCFISVSVFGWDGSHYQQNVSFFQMDEGYIYVQLKDVPSMCTGGNVWGVIRHDIQSHRHMYSLLLSAQVSGKKVDIHANACSTPAGYCCIGSITIHDD